MKIIHGKLHEWFNEICDFGLLIVFNFQIFISSKFQLIESLSSLSSITLVYVVVGECLCQIDTVNSPTKHETNGKDK